MSLFNGVWSPVIMTHSLATLPDWCLHEDWGSPLLKSLFGSLDSFGGLTLLSYFRSFFSNVPNFAKGSFFLEVEFPRRSGQR